MHNNNRKLDFERVSEVLKTRLVINKEMDIINEEVAQHADGADGRQDENDAIFYDENSNDEYLFGDYQPDPARKKHQKPKQPSQISKPLSQDVVVAEPNEGQSKPVIKRRVSRAASESNQIKRPAKPRYNKKDNAGNELVRIQKIQTIFRKICEPNRTITVNSLGHALQRFKIKFQLKDIVEMLGLYQDMTNPQKEVSDSEDKQQELDLNAKMNENQFKEFFQMIRKKPKE